MKTIHFKKTAIFGLTSLMIILLSCGNGWPQKKVTSYQHPQSQTFDSTLLNQVKLILSHYQPEALTAEDARAIHEKFHEAGLQPGPGMHEAIVATGFDPDKLRTLDPPPVGHQQGSDQRPSPEERMNRINEKIIAPLQVNEQQKKEIVAAFSEFFAEMDQIQKNSMVQPERSKIEAIEKQRDEQVKKVLSCEQFVNYLELEKAARPPRPE